MEKLKKNFDKILESKSKIKCKVNEVLYFLVQEKMAQENDVPFPTKKKRKDNYYKSEPEDSHVKVETNDIT